MTTLSATRRAVERFILDGDARGLVDAGLAADVMEIPTASDREGGRTAALEAAGWKYWCGYLAAPVLDGEALIAFALYLFEPLSRVSPKSIPLTLRAVIERAGAYPNGILHGYWDIAKLIAGDPDRHVTRMVDIDKLDLSIALYLRMLLGIDDLTGDEKIGLFTNLGASYFDRYHHGGEYRDIHLAIRQHEQAVSMTPPEHRFRSLVEANLRSSLNDWVHGALDVAPRPPKAKPGRAPWM